MKDITDRIRDNLLSHSESPLRLVRGLAVVAVSLPIISGCATERGNARAAQHSADQIKIVAVQREAQLKEAQAEAQTNTALVEALARVAEANPQHAPSVAVALAVIGVSGGQSGEGDTDRVVTLQQQQNTALEWTKALAPTVGGLVTGLGVAAIQADVTKTQSDNSRAVQESSNETSARIVESVATVGVANAGRLGIQVAGDYVSATDNAVIDQSVTTNTTSTSTTTSTSVADSYNTQSSDTNFSQGDNGLLNTGEYSDPYAYTETNSSLTNTVTTDTTVTYQGSTMSLGELVSYLQGLGTPYSLSVGGEVVAASTDGTGQTTTIDCSGPLFSPAPPECT